MRVAFIGTGLMGHPMAERVLAGGHELIAYNRTREKAEPLARKGARIAGSAREAIEMGECTLFMVRDGSVVRELLSDEGFIPSLGGRTVIQMSTIGPAESIRLMEDVRGAAGDYLEAPVLGSVPQAEEGKLLVMVGGSSEQLGHWGELLRCFGPDPRLVGPVGHAATLKLAMNQLIASLAASFSLSLGMVRRKGIEVDLFMDILRKSAFYAPTFDRKLPQMLSRDFSNANFPTALLLKDLDLARAEADGLGLDTAALDGVRDVVKETVEDGKGREDYAALYATIDPAS
ncbi:MAG TPA: NAD(P)-dependent oxidoreductase [Thermoanaerobaculia bacterium]|jgi:3-hydroxyisobutyrate dehydrogenase-like beta-hydroxyacid dehydrogenase|nr:NAD(P)-dependent oxidoreductase [Thermoanaerobaculia bacterium]